MHYSSCKIRTSLCTKCPCGVQPLCSAHMDGGSCSLGSAAGRLCSGDKTPLSGTGRAALLFLGRCLVLPNILWNLVGIVALVWMCVWELWGRPWLRLRQGWFRNPGANSCSWSSRALCRCQREKWPGNTGGFCSHPVTA